MRRYVWSAQSANSSGVESPATIGQKFLRTLDALSRIDPILGGWVIWVGHRTLDELEAWAERGSPEPAPVKLVTIDDARKNITALVETNVSLDDWGEEQPDEGFNLIASNRHDLTPLGVNISITAGAKLERNSWSLNFGADWTSPPDTALLSLPLMGGIFRTMTAIWPTPWARLQGTTSEQELRPSKLGFGRTSVETFRQDITWMGYLSAELANGLDSPAKLTAERTPDGGVVLTAFQGPPDPENADQMRRSGLLGAIMDKTFPDPFAQLTGNGS